MSQLFEFNFIVLLYSDGRSHVQRRQNSVESKQYIINKEESGAPCVIPRTQRQNDSCRPQSREEFLIELKKKLDDLYRKQQTNEKLWKHLHPGDPTDGASRLPPIPSRNQSNLNSQLVADALFRLEDDDQSILDLHVSRVWADSPHRSPGTVSPAVPSRRRPHDSLTTGIDGKTFDFD